MFQYLEGIIIFVLFLGPLIFFHELGHFLFARFFGVKVEIFSLGFGPKILKFNKGGTEYAISAIPLGGYVKMFGDDPFSEVPLTEDEKKVAFNHKSKWARFWIVFGGPLANFLLAYLLYVGLLTTGEKVPETKLGLITEKSMLFQKGLRTGDVLTTINDEKILSFDDFNIKGSRVDSISLRRGDAQIVLKIEMGIEDFIQEFVQHVSPLRKPYVINSKGEKFLISLVQGQDKPDSTLEEVFSNFKGKAFLYQLKENEKKELVADFKTESMVSSTEQSDLSQLLASLEFYPTDLAVKSIVMASPADKAGIRSGNILLAINNKPIKNFEELRQQLQLVEDGKEVEVTLLADSKQVTKKLIPQIKESEGKKIKLLGIESNIIFAMPSFVFAREENFFKALVTGVYRTYEGILKTFSGYKKLITREVSLKNIGGPLAIGKVATDSFNIGLSMFFRLMAIISINLGVINLFPIPVLDGGHIMFLGFEAVNRGPLSRRKLEIAQKFGLSILFFLIFVALFNDLKRFL